MKALSLWQPWASLISFKEKWIETRSWKAPQYLIGQRFAIHATLKKDDEVCQFYPFRETLLKHLKTISGSEKFDLPTGAIVATCILKDCVQIESHNPDKLNPYAVLSNGHIVSGNEFYFGDYSPGRWAWILDDIKPLEKPIQAKGRQRIWELDDILLNKGIR